MHVKVTNKSWNADACDRWSVFDNLPDDEVVRRCMCFGHYRGKPENYRVAVIDDDGTELRVIQEGA